MLAKNKLPYREQGDVIYRIANYIRWVVQVDAVHVINTQTGGHHRLFYPQAAIWDMLSRNYSIDKIAHLLMPIADVNVEEAQHLVKDILSDWRSEGFLKTETPGG